MSLENLNYDLCDACYQSIDNKEKKLYGKSTADPMAQYAKVLHYVVCICNAESLSGPCVVVCLHLKTSVPEIISPS